MTLCKKFVLVSGHFAKITCPKSNTKREARSRWTTQNHYISKRFNVEKLTFFTFVTLVCMIAMWHNFNHGWVCCITPWTSVSQAGQTVETLIALLAIGIMFHVLIKYFCFSRRWKICFKLKTLYYTTSDITIRQTSFKFKIYEFLKVVNSFYFSASKPWHRGILNGLEVTDNEVRYLMSNVRHHYFGCLSGQSHYNY